jgi:hypothetical protein
MIRVIIRSVIAALFVASCIVVAAPRARASAPAANSVVLDREGQWMAALAKGNKTALGAILSWNYVHIDYKGAVDYRDEALANINQYKDYTIKPGEQTVDLFGNTAIVHGVYTVSKGGNVVKRLRYTDVYVKQNGAWQAASAQETPITQ